MPTWSATASSSSRTADADLPRLDERPERVTVVGTLEDWDVTDRLGEINVRTLLTGGRHDECRPEHLADMQARISGSELVIFEDSSHMAFAEERERYLAVVGDFLARVESA